MELCTLNCEIISDERTLNTAVKYFPSKPTYKKSMGICLNKSHFPPGLFFLLLEKLSLLVFNLSLKHELSLLETGVNLVLQRLCLDLQFLY